MNKNFVADDNVTLFESLAIGNATVDEFTINTDAKKVINTIKANKKLTESTAKLSNDETGSVMYIIKRLGNKGFDTNSKEVQEYAQQVAEYIEYANSVDELDRVPDYDFDKWYKDTLTNYPEELDALPKILTEATTKLSNKEKSFSGQMINVWDKLDNVSSVPEIISFVKDNFKDTPYKEKVLNNLESKKNVMSAIGYLSSIVTKGDGITLNKGKQESLKEAGKADAFIETPIQIVTSLEEKCDSVEARRHARVLKESMRKFFIDPEEDTEMYVDKDGTTHSLMELKCKWNGNPTSTELQNYATKEDWLADTLENMDYVGKDNTRLTEAIPRDLANAYKKYNINNINDHANAMTDFQNAEYDEITPEEAIALKKAGKADQVIAKIGDNPVRFYDDGSAKLYREQDADLNVRKNFGTLVKNADKIYKTNEDDKDLKQSLADKRNQKSAQRTLPSNKRDYYYNDDREIERRTGVHRRKDSETIDQRYLNRYKDALAKLNQQYEDGDISRKEYEATKAPYEDSIKRLETRVKEHEKRVKEQENERKQELMRGAETRNMSAPIDRFKEIKRNNTEAALAASNKEIEKKSQDVEAKIKALEAQLAKLKADKQNDSNLRWATQRKNDLEKQLEKEQSDMAAIKSGKYVPESLESRVALKESLADNFPNSIGKYDLYILNPAEYSTGGANFTPEEFEDAFGKNVRNLYFYEDKENEGPPFVGVEHIDGTLDVVGGRKDEFDVSEERFVERLTDLYAYDVFEHLTEDVESVEIETEDNVTTVDIEDEGKVEITAEPKDIGKDVDEEDVIEEIPEGELNDLMKTEPDEVDITSDEESLEDDVLDEV